MHIFRWPSRSKKRAYTSYATVMFLICIIDLIIALSFITFFSKSKSTHFTHLYGITYDTDETEKVEFEESTAEEYTIAAIIFILFLLRGLFIWGANLTSSAVIYSVNYLSARNLRRPIIVSRKAQTEAYTLDKMYPCEKSYVDGKSMNSSSGEFADVYPCPSTLTFTKEER